MCFKRNIEMYTMDVYHLGCRIFDNKDDIKETSLLWCSRVVVELSLSRSSLLGNNIVHCPLSLIGNFTITSVIFWTKFMDTIIKV